MFLLGCLSPENFSEIRSAVVMGHTKLDIAIPFIASFVDTLGSFAFDRLLSPFLTNCLIRLRDFEVHSLCNVVSSDHLGCAGFLFALQTSHRELLVSLALSGDIINRIST